MQGIPEVTQTIGITSTSISKDITKILTKYLNTGKSDDVDLDI